MRPIVKAFGHLLAPTASRFYQALENPQQAQAKVQQRLINRLQRCEYGQQFQIRSRKDWHRLPIVSYEDIQSHIDPTTHRSPLSPERILFYEPTSGSSGPIKQIPYTRSLRRAFNHLFCIWAHDLIAHGPTFSTGKLYFSISPTFSKTTAGTTDDSDYLDPWLRHLLSPFLVISPSAKTPTDFKENLARTLLKAEDLEIISIWSPSFLTVQLDYIQKHQQHLYESLKGQLSQARSHYLLQPQISWHALWPHLKLISCWDSALAADSAHSLRSRFPNTLIQGKGLLATEAPLTLPLIQAKGHVPLLDQIYFEFEDDQQQRRELHQLEIGQTYELIISQTGGLYRYRMSDRVQVTHRFRQTPCLKFIGRGPTISDLVGEKLNVQFVTRQLANLNLQVTFQSLVPVRQPQPHYALLLDRINCPANTLAQELESALRQSFHYQLARQLDQLAPAKVIVCNNIAEQLAAQKSQQGQRWGDIKHNQLGSVIENLDFLRNV